MARPRALTGEREAEALKLLASGVSASAIGRRFGVDHKTVLKLRNQAMSGANPPSTSAEQRETDPGPARDQFEAEQVDSLRRIETAMESPKVGAVGLAALVKARNDTIKAIRAHRAMGSQGTEPDELAAVAEQVRSRLERLSKAKRAAEPVAAVEPKAKSEDDKTGT